MPLFSSSPEEKAAKAAAAQQRAADQAAENERRRQADERRAFFDSPAGQARLAFERGDAIFQLQLVVGTQRAHIVPDRANPTAMQVGRGRDANQDLNAVSAEGWDLITGSVEFVPSGSKTREGFTGGEHTSMSGELIGHYLFRRASAPYAELPATGSGLAYRPTGGA